MTNATRAMLAILIAGSSGVTRVAQQRTGSAKDRLVGAWGLVSFVSFDANGASRPARTISVASSMTPAARCRRT
jgi:hypothetical protein